MTAPSRAAATTGVDMDFHAILPFAHRNEVDREGAAQLSDPGMVGDGIDSAGRQCSR